MKNLLLLLVGLPLISLGQKADFSGLKKINGTDLFVSIQGQGDVLVVLHGGPGLNHSYFKPHLDGLHKKFNVVYYDQRACGQSAAPDADSISLEFFINDIEALRKELEVHKISILAHSWASILAVNYALKYPDRINKLILSNPAPLSKAYEKEMSVFIQEHTSSADSLNRASIISNKDFTLKNFEKLFKISFRASAYNPDNMERLQLNLPENFLRAQQALFTGLGKDLTQYNFYSELKKFQFPVLIIQGKADGIPMASITKLKDSISKSTVVVFEKSGHFPFIEETMLYSKTVSKFLSSMKRQKKSSRKEL